MKRILINNIKVIELNIFLLMLIHVHQLTMSNPYFLYNRVIKHYSLPQKTKRKTQATHSAKESRSS